MKSPNLLPTKSTNAVSRIAIIGTVLGLAAFQAEAVTIEWDKPSESTETYAGTGLNGNGNTRVNDDTSVATVTAYAEYYAASTYTTPGVSWASAHLDQDSNYGLGVRNTLLGDSQEEIDNTGSFDRVVFSFSTSVILDSAKLWQDGRADTDITIFAHYNSVWNLVESQTGTGLDRTANINNATPKISATKWAIAASVLAGDQSSADAFRVKEITFTAAPETRAPNPVPDTGSGILLSSIGIGMLALVKRFSGKKVA
ncbi:MAG: hypothetical protein JHD00_12400 [Akkermansiaceae bacterium]|nr:hypothetical protein [Akkermansiaceae bacterium]